MSRPLNDPMDSVDKDEEHSSISAWSFLNSIPHRPLLLVVTLVPALVLLLAELLAVNLPGTLRQWRRIAGFEVFAIMAYAYVHHNVEYLTLGCMQAITNAEQAKSFSRLRDGVLQVEKVKLLIGAAFSASTLVMLPLVGTGSGTVSTAIFGVIYCVSTFIAGYCLAFLIQTGRLVIYLSSCDIRVGTIPQASIAMRNSTTIASQVALTFMLGVAFALSIYVSMDWVNPPVARQIAYGYGAPLIFLSLLVLMWPQILLQERSRHFRDQLLLETEQSFSLQTKSFEGVSATKDRSDHVEKMSAYVTRLRETKLVDVASFLRYTAAAAVTLLSVGDKYLNGVIHKEVLAVLKALLGP